MKILVLQDYLRSGGTERQSILLANAFAAAGHEATLLTFRPGGALDATVSQRVRRHALQPFDLGLDWFAPGLAGFARRARPDVILCMGRMANCYAAGLQGRVRDTAVVATVRTGRNLPALFRRSLHRSRHIVANSHEARDVVITEHALPAQNVTVIHNALVFPAAASSVAALGRDHLRSEYGADVDTTVLLCVAMFRPEKNQRELIEMVADLPTERKWQLWLAGDGPARAACERLVSSRLLGPRVKFPGFHRDPSPLYRAADIAVHASWSEALSNFLIEAQAHGLPFVAFAAQGIRECCLPGRTGWVIAREDRAGFHFALLQRMSDSPTTRAACAAAARDFARTTFDPARQVAAYLALFARLV